MPPRATHELGPLVSERATEIERLGRLPDDVLKALSRAGCFRLFAPTWVTGSCPGYSGALRIIESLARADGSVGWSVAQCALGQIILGYLPQTTLKRVYEPGPDVCVAGVFAPKGRASRTAAGWRVSGRWPFASGCLWASWVYGQCLVMERRRVLLRDDGMPVTRLAVLPADRVEILATWDALGLQGTGSQDLQVNDQNCPEEWTCSLAEGHEGAEGIQSIFLADHAGLFVAAVASGIASGAIDDVACLAAEGKRPTFSPRRLADDPVFQERLGWSFMTVAAAEALLWAQAQRVESALGGATLSPVDRAGLRATCRQVTALALQATDALYELAGSSSVPRTSRLQRRFRDIHTAAQHAWNSPFATQQLGVSLVDPAQP
jgi:alkylation response protein AidB-like acyl-CoA dehydrogenase